MATKVGVLLSGCGYLDGTEIHEAVLTLLVLDQLGAEAICLAPDTEFDVVDHVTGEATGERRNVLRESARITRGRILDVAEVSAEALDALVVPGGFGAAKNLSNFAEAGSEMAVLPSVEALIRSVHRAGKPIGAICIAPAVMAKLLPGVILTIGEDPATADALEAMGAVHAVCPVTECVIDDQHRVVSTPAYMLGPWVGDVYGGVERCIRAVLDMAVGQTAT